MLQPTVLGGALLQTHFQILVLGDGLATLFGLGRVHQSVGDEVLATLLHWLELLGAVHTELLLGEVVSLATLFLESTGGEVHLVLHLPLTGALFARHGLAALLEQFLLLLDVHERVGTAWLDVGLADLGAVGTTSLVGHSSVHVLDLFTTGASLLLAEQFDVLQHVLTGTLVLVLVLGVFTTAVDDLV